jgi:hypothetical protein
VQGRRKKALSHAAAEILFSLTDPPPYTADNDGNTKRQRQHAGGPTLHNVWGMYLMNTPRGVHAHGTLGGGASLESGARPQHQVESLLEEYWYFFGAQSAAFGRGKGLIYEFDRPTLSCFPVFQRG